jgi:hypothetical protein
MLGLGILAVLLFISVVLLWVLSVKLLKERDLYVERIADLEQVAAAEYERALEEGKAQVRTWAVDANYNVYISDAGTAQSKAIAAFQEAVRQFAPKRLN